MIDNKDDYISKMKKIKQIFDDSNVDRINDNDELESLINDVNDYEKTFGTDNLNIDFLYDKDEDLVS